MAASDALYLVCSRPLVDGGPCRWRVARASGGYLPGDHTSREAARAALDAMQTAPALALVEASA